MNKNVKKIKGAVLAIVIIVLTLLASAGAAYEMHKAKEKNSSKATIATVTEVQAAKEKADALADANTKANQAQEQLKAAHQDALQNIAGNANGAKMALDSDPNPSIESKIASVMIDNVLVISGPATSKQVEQFQKIIKDLMVSNQQLVIENTNLKNVNINTTASLNDAKLQAEQSKSQLALSQQNAVIANAAKDAAVKQNLIAINVAQSSAKQINIVNLTWTERVKAWVLGLGFSGIAIALILFAVLPILAEAFPVFEPIAKSLTGWLLGLWHRLAAKALALEQSLHATTKTQLAAEQAAHNVTKATLTTTQAQVVSIATSPTPADQLVASMAAPAVKATTPTT